MIGIRFVSIDLNKEESNNEHEEQRVTTAFLSEGLTRIFPLLSLAYEPLGRKLPTASFFSSFFSYFWGIC